MVKHITLSLSLLLISFLSFGQLTGDGTSGSPYSGTMTSDLSWSNQDVYIDGDFTVASGLTLAVGAGTTVYVSAGANILNNGTLTITGTSADSVLFTSTSSQTSWGHIEFTANSSGSITYCRFENGHSLNGGAIYLNTTNNVPISHSTFANNTVYTNATMVDGDIEGAGGAIYVASGTGHSIIASSFEGNSAIFSLPDAQQSFERLAAVGGAVFVAYNSSVSISGCTFSGNDISISASVSAEARSDWPSSRAGGAIFLVGAATITNCLFTGNSSSAAGGAICFSAFGGHPSKGSTVSNCIFDGNTSLGNYFQFTGGAVAIVNQSSATIANCTFVNNSSPNYARGQAIKMHYGNDDVLGTVLSRISNCVFWSSSSSDDHPISASFCDEVSLRNAFSYCAFSYWPSLQIDGLSPFQRLENLSNSFIISNNNTEIGSGAFFKDPANHDWSIQMSSRLLNVGGGNDATTSGYLGNNVTGGTRDIGAYELQYAIFTQTAATDPTITINDVTYHDFFNPGNWTDTPFDENGAVVMDMSIPADGHNAYISEDLSIPAEYSLNVYAGRTIAMNSAADIDVSGFLNTYGSNESNVLFTSPQQNGSWGHISFLSSASGSINYTTIEHGSSANGGALFLNSNGTIEVNNVTFSSNSATVTGGAIHVTSGTPSISYSTFSNNSAPLGGAIYNEGTATIDSVSFSDNTSTNNGGALYVNNGTIVLIDCVLAENSATNNGGSIFVNAGSLTVTGIGSGFTSTSSFGSNQATSGGAVYLNGGTTSFANTYFTGNHVSGAGGAVTLANNSSGEITNCVFSGNYTSGNTSSATGGALAILTNGSTSITNCTLVNNTTGYQYGGAILLSGATTSIMNSVFWNSTTASSIYSTISLSDIISYCAFSTQPVDNNGTFTNNTSIQISSTNNDQGTPNGPFFNDPSQSNWTIASSSPLRNAGNPQTTIGDILGKERNNIRDIGAYEAPYAQFVGGGTQTLGDNYYDFSASNNWSENPFNNDGALVMDLGVEYLSDATLYIDESISITSGYSLTVGSGATVVVGGGYNITIEDNAALIISGSTDTVTFTRAGQSNWGHIIFNANSTGRIDGGLFEYGGSTSSGVNGQGGVFYINTNGVNINNSTFRSNTANTGGVIYVASGQPSISNSYFNNNNSTSNGGVFNITSGADITNCVFVANTSANGNGGALATTSSAATNITNCTFVNNTAVNGNALYASQAITNIVNSVFWSSSPEQSSHYQIYNTGGTPSMSYSAYTTLFGISNITNSRLLDNENQGLNPKGPFFKNTNLEEGDDNWSILVISPLRDAGDPNSTSTEGIEGQEVVYRRDIGAYEARYARFQGAQSCSEDSLYREAYFIRDRANWVNADNGYYPFVPLDTTFMGNLLKTTMDIVIPQMANDLIPADGFHGSEHNSPTHGSSGILISPGYYYVIEPHAKTALPRLWNFGTIRLQTDGTRTGTFRGFNNGNTFEGPGLVEIELFLSGGTTENGEYKWHYIASPFDDMSTNVFTGETEATFGEADFNLARYDQSATVFNEGWVTYDGYHYSDGSTDVNDTFNTMNLGQGYNYYGSEDHTYLLSGTNLNVRDTPVPLSYDADSNNGWNFIGNPYSVAVDAELLFAGNGALFGQTIGNDDGVLVVTQSPQVGNGIYYTKDNVQYTYCRYLISPLPEGNIGLTNSETEPWWNRDVIYNPLYQRIPPMQGFFLRVYQQPEQNLLFTTDMKQHDFPGYYKGSSSEAEKFNAISMIRLALVGDTSYFDDTVLRFTLKQATTATNDTLDTFKKFKSESNNLISTTLNDAEYAIKSMPYPEETSFEVPVNVQVIKSGKYTIGVKEIQNLDDYLFSIRDNLTGYTVELNERTPFIQFTSDVGNFPNRFTLFITNSGYITAVEDISNDIDDINIYYSNDKINIVPINGIWNNSAATVIVYDLSGRVMDNHGVKQLSTNIITEVNAPKAHGMYLVEIKGKSRKVVGKIVK